MRWLFLLLATHTYAQPFYSRTIHTPPHTDRQLMATITDMQYHLQRLSRDTFMIDTSGIGSQAGISLIRLDRNTTSTYDSRLDKSNADMFLLHADTISSMQIIAYSDVGLTDGIYTYLDLLGFRWYHPGDLWTHIPDRADIRIAIDSVFRPDFLERGFFGSYGTPRNTLIDKDACVDHQWLLWARRNRQQSDYELRGHAWDNFLWKNYDSLKLHPEYMALVAGHRQAPNSSAKFCLSNKSLRELFISYQLTVLRKDMKAHPDRTHYIESVEPSDGYGDCECDLCRQMGSVSTRDFTLANEVAQAFSKVSPLAAVNLLAYYTHADTPAIHIASNVVVQIVPYRYQIAMPTERLIEAWEQKKDTLFMYDYFGMPMWNADMPLKTRLRPVEYSKRIKYWYDHKVRGMYLESSCSIASTGLGLYLYSRLGWEVHSDVDTLISQYYRDNYGTAAEAMHGAHEILSDSVDYAGTLYRVMDYMSTHLHERGLTPQQHERIVSFKAYLHYLKLYYDFKDGDKKLEPQTTDSIIRYVHSIYFRMLVSQYALVQHIITYGSTAAYIKKYWDVDHLTATDSKFSTVVQYTDAQIEKLYNDDCKQMKQTHSKKNRDATGSNH